MVIKRDHYVNQVIAKRWNGKVKIITGLRRCGKSYLLSVLYKGVLLSEGVSESDIIELSLEKKSNAKYRNPIALQDYILSKASDPARKYYVFIDEIQLTRKVLPPDVDLARIAPEDRDSAYLTFYDTLNGLRQLDHVDVYVTGSNSKTLSSDIESNFADRGVQIRVHPFTFSEYCEATSPSDMSAAFERYLIWGGMPLAVAEDDDRARARYLQGLFGEVYVNDIRQRHRLRDTSVLENLIDVIASATGSLTNPHKLANTLESRLRIKSNDHTIGNYLGYLKDAFLFGEAKRYDVRGKSYFDYPNKYYCEDVGLRNARTGFREIDHPHLMENVIYCELVRRGFSVDVGVVHSWRKNAKGSSVKVPREIDFVVNKSSERVYVQSAYRMDDGEKAEQELRPFSLTGDAFRRIVIRQDIGRRSYDQGGVLHIPLIDFLCDEGCI